MKLLLRSRIYARWDEKSADGSSTYVLSASGAIGRFLVPEHTHLHDLATQLHE